MNPIVFLVDLLCGVVERALFLEWGDDDGPDRNED